MTPLAQLGIETRASGRTEQRVPCPQCGRGPGDDALGVNIEDGRYHCFRCGWRGRATVDGTSPPASATPISYAALAERKRERLRTTYRQTFPLDHPKARPVRRYLESRALGAVLAKPPKALRAHPGLEYWDGTRRLGAYPAMVGLFYNSAGTICTLHVTYLRQDGCAKASVPSPKKILGVPVAGATRGGAIRLFDPRGGVLGVAEGIESALSLHVIRKVPTWASFCADNLERIRLPEDLRALQIGVDLDPNGKGEAVAQALAKRVMRWNPRIRVTYIKPDLGGPGDLNDELRRWAS